MADTNTTNTDPDTTPPWIGVCGPARSGKDTLGRFISKLTGRHRRVAFADAVREVLLHTNPIVEVDSPIYARARVIRLGDLIEEVGWEEAKSTCPEVRRLLADLGMGMRYVSPNAWLDIALDQAWTLTAYSEAPVFTDVRFPNEVAAIREAGGYLVRVVRRDRTGITMEGDLHASERALDDTEPDVIVINNGTIDDLQAATPLVLQALEASAFGQRVVVAATATIL